MKEYISILWFVDPGSRFFFFLFDPIFHSLCVISYRIFDIIVFLKGSGRKESSERLKISSYSIQFFTLITLWSHMNDNFIQNIRYYCFLKRKRIIPSSQRTFKNSRWPITAPLPPYPRFIYRRASLMHRAECSPGRAIIDRISMRLSSGSRAIQETRVPGKSRASPEGVQPESWDSHDSRAGSAGRKERGGWLYYCTGERAYRF